MEKIWNAAKHYWTDHKKVVLVVVAIVVIAVIL
jgi:hypothetical protein